MLRRSIDLFFPTKFVHNIKLGSKNYLKSILRQEVFNLRNVKFQSRVNLIASLSQIKV